MSAPTRAELHVPAGAAAATKQLLLAANGEHHDAQEARERTAQLTRLRAIAAAAGLT